MAYYEEPNAAMHEKIQTSLERKTDLKARLRAVIDVKFEYFAPNWKFLGALLKYTADPEHPLSSFKRETKEMRERDMLHFSEALDGSSVKLTGDLRPHLPELLWLYQMALILFWIYDRSEKQARTERLVEKSLGIIVSLLKLSKSPFLRPVRRSAIELLQLVSSEYRAVQPATPPR